LGRAGPPAAEAPPGRGPAGHRVWFVLGVPRLHHAIATGRLTSKDGAGHHAVATFGERWRPVVAEALTCRALGEPSGRYDGQEALLAEETAAFAELALESALALRP